MLVVGRGLGRGGDGEGRGARERENSSHARHHVLSASGVHVVAAAVEEQQVTLETC